MMISSCESFPTSNKKVIILGSGPNRIGQGIEFDYSCVHASRALREIGIESIMVNCNPETVSTDYDTSDRLYFEPLTAEDVVSIAELEMSKGELLGVIVQFGGQTPLSLSKYLREKNIPILGTSQDMIDLAEDRERFRVLIEDLHLNQPKSFTTTSVEDLNSKIKNIGFPIVIRPSYVIGGQKMEVIYDETQLRRYFSENPQIFQTGPVLIDEFLTDAIEIDVDAISDSKDVYVAGIMQHVEEAGIHSGDSACSIPPYSLEQSAIDKIHAATVKLALALNVKGMINVQYAVKGNDLYVIEVNPRASRTLPFVAKATGVSIAKIATFVMAGKSLKSFNLKEKLTLSELGYYCVKEVVLPFARFGNSDTVLGPEMKSTGEVMGIDKTFPLAFAKSQIAAGFSIPTSGTAFLSVKDMDKKHITQIASSLSKLGFKIVATKGTAKFLNDNKISATEVKKIKEGSPHIVDMLENGEVNLVINTTQGAQSLKDSFAIRRTVLMKMITYTTTISGANALVSAIKEYKDMGSKFNVISLQKMHSVS